MKIKNFINETKDSIETLTNRLDHIGTEFSAWKTRHMNLNPQISIKKKKIRNHDQNMKELWDNIKKSNLKTIVTEKRTEKQDNGTNAYSVK